MVTGRTHSRGHAFAGELTFLLLLWHDPVDLVGLRDVQLGPVCHLLKVRALVQSAAKPRLPRGRLRFVTFLELAFENSPGLKQRMQKKKNPKKILPVSSTEPLREEELGLQRAFCILHPSQASPGDSLFHS